ncbi:putative deoxyhypusine synthase [Thalassoglobus neptunius]|uniref:Putative deoxyhypusine synthase n=1 Tax=Thalassoglobus neptunius TaxID=1938619 RepID=A0A5C5W8D2_9PLAN|nr:deoxyhypusine synthase family protein [Thalassoglobus neptunius]TWT46980.1 putative deoxyhypusine synthase [Thalassoglobus neptunius]
MSHRELHDGRDDGLKPLESLDLGNVDSFADLLRGMSKTAFAGRQLGHALDIFLEMARDPDCVVVMTLSGAMTVAKMGTVICEMIDRGLVDAVVSTGALMAHGLTESIGLSHYEYDPTKNDTVLFEQGYNRVYDTLEMESNLNDVERLVRAVLTETPPPEGCWSSARLCRELGRKLDTLGEGRGILRSAFQKEVPVFIPAFTDSEVGLDVSTWAMRKALADRDASQLSHEEAFNSVPIFNPFLDLQEYARLAGRAKRLGIFTIGGGVPRNWAQQVAPYVDITNDRVGTKFPAPRFRSAIRICPEPVHWGGLSGCTYTEGVSWGKFLPPSEGGRFAEVHCDATSVWPLLMKAVFEELDASS